MSRPTDKNELLIAMADNVTSLRQVVETIDPSDREIAGACEQWSVKDILAHLDAWHEMFLEWEQVGAAGAKPEMPAAGLTWKETPQLNLQIWERTRNDSYAEVVARLEHSYERVRAVVDGYEADELFEKKRYPWTGSTSVGAYAVSATSSHYDWALNLIRKFIKGLG